MEVAIVSDDRLDEPAIASIEMLEVLKALADPVRLLIVRKLADTEYLSCSVVNDDLEVHKSTLSHHYKVLRESGVTSTLKNGRSRDIRLRREDLDERFPGLLSGVLAGTKTLAP